MTERETYLELIEIGGSIRVAAVDSQTGEEVVFQVPKNTSRSEIESLAVSKLSWKLGKTDSNKKRPDSKSGRGITV